MIKFLLFIMFNTVFNGLTSGQERVLGGEKTSIKLTSLECEFDKIAFVNSSCKLRAIRGKLGLFEYNYTIVHSLDDILFSVKLFYKFGMRYRQYLFDYTINICELLDETTSDKSSLEKFIITAIKTIRPHFLHPCPFVPGTTSLTVSPDDFFNILFNSFKFVLPQGDHKWEISLHNSKNHTYFKFIIKTTLKAGRGIDLSMLNMG